MKIMLPKPRPKKIVVTDTMTEIINRTLAVHTLSALVVWSGQSRLGKTTTGCYMVDQLNQQFDENNPDSLRAVYYEVGEIKVYSGNEMKKGIRSLYQGALHSQLDEGFYRNNPPEAIAEQLVYGLLRKRIQLIVVDEAGCLSLDAIRGMTLVRDIAESKGYTLTIVFVGMDDLPQKINILPQIRYRVKEWCNFSQYTLDETWALLKELHPYFASLDGSKATHREQVEVVQELCLGLPGLIVPFVQKFDYRLTNYKDEVDVRFLRAVYELTNKSMMASLKEAKRNYHPYDSDERNKKQKAAPKAPQEKPKKRESKKNVIPFKPTKST
jgi:AAA domain